jgi:plastocyanin
MNLQRLLAIGGALVIMATVAACNGSSSGSSYSSPTAPSSPPPAVSGGSTPDLTITITGMNGANSFSPNPATVKAGQSVAWRNADSIGHTATADGGAFDTGIIAPGATSNTIVMSVAGSFGYHCAVHPTMTGTLSVSQ